MNMVTMAGCGAVAPRMEELVALLERLLKGQACCQNPEFQGEDEDEDETMEHDHVLIDQVSDLVGAMARAFGPQFAGHFKQLVRAHICQCEIPAAEYS